MNIFIACADAGSTYPSISPDGRYWACSMSWDDIVQLAQNAPSFYPFLDYIYELSPGTTGYVNRWRWNYEARTFELWNE